MITLYTFGPNFGLPDASPFVCKAIVLLEMSGLAYRTDRGGFSQAPRGKLPFVEDDGVIVTDSTMIRRHLEEKHGIDFDKGLSAADKAVAWAMEKLCEDHLYWILMRERWLDDANFDKGPRNFFNVLPALIRPIAAAKVRREMRRSLHGQGIGRMSSEEVRILAERAAATLSVQLGDKPWMMGAEPTALDAAAWSFVAASLCREFECDSRKAMEARANLVAYRDRGLALWFDNQD